MVSCCSARYRIILAPKDWAETWSLEEGTLQVELSLAISGQERATTSSCDSAKKFYRTFQSVLGPSVVCLIA